MPIDITAPVTSKTASTKDVDLASSIHRNQDMGHLFTIERATQGTGY